MYFLFQTPPLFRSYSLFQWRAPQHPKRPESTTTKSWNCWSHFFFGLGLKALQTSDTWSSVQSFIVQQGDVSSSYSSSYSLFYSLLDGGLNWGDHCSQGGRTQVCCPSWLAFLIKDPWCWKQSSTGAKIPSLPQRRLEGSPMRGQTLCPYQ